MYLSIKYLLRLQKGIMTYLPAICMIPIYLILIYLDRPLPVSSGEARLLPIWT